MERRTPLTRRTALKPGKPLPRGKGPERRTRIAPVNSKRKAKEFRRDFHSKGFCDWVRSLGCSVPSCTATDIGVAHATSRGAGGTWMDCLPLCAGHHRLQHDIGVQSFERRVGFHLSDVAASVAMRWMAFTHTE